MDIFEKLRNGDPVDMLSEAYRPVVEELNRADLALYHVNHSAPHSDEQKKALDELFDGHYPESLGLFTPVQIDFPKQITFGKNVFINHSFTAMSIGGIVIGDNVQMGPHVTIVTDNHDMANRYILKCRTVHIGNNAWIGADASIMPGVTIGENAVVAGGAVVVKDVPAGAIVGGNPAKIIRFLKGYGDTLKPKTIRLLYPDHVSGGLDTYYFGANLMQHILPQNLNQKLVRVAVAPPDGQQKTVTEGITAEDEVLTGIADAQAKIAAENPDKIITIGGNCLVSLAPFDYLHGKYENTGIIWIDAHPDVSTVEDGYPFAHAMVLGTLLGGGAKPLRRQMKNHAFRPDQVLYVGLQPLHDYQEKFLKEQGVDYKIQDQAFVTDGEIRAFMERFDHILVHFDIDVLDEHYFHSTYYANPELIGDGAGGGKMTMDKLTQILKLITENSDVVGFTVAEYLPFDEERLYKMFNQIRLFTE